MREKKLITDIAKERIETLIKEATKIEQGNNPRHDLSKRYLLIAKQIKEHYKINDKTFKKAICKQCGTILIPGKSCTVTIASSKRKIIYKCNNCSFETKIHY
jgi:RNase P subunit RPR2